MVRPNSDTIYMRLLDLTLPTPAENLALDEALLAAAEQSGAPDETLRFWESQQPIVVVGRSSRVAAEVHVDACKNHGVPIFRRISGGSAIVAGPGCLMYALVLSYELRPHFRSLDAAHRDVLGALCGALTACSADVRRQGTSDLAIGSMKFSGNSVRCRRRHLLYHGTLLYNFALPKVAQCLRQPPREPNYRQSRSHEQFLTNIPATAAALRRAIQRAWQATVVRAAWPAELTASLAGDKYGDPSWNLQH